MQTSFMYFVQTFFLSIAKCLSQELMILLLIIVNINPCTHFQCVTYSILKLQCVVYISVITSGHMELNFVHNNSGIPEIVLFLW